MDYFPLFIKTKNCHVVMVGGGTDIVHKLRLMLKTTAEVHVFGAIEDASLADFCAKGAVQHHDRAVSDNGTAFLQDILDARPSLSISNLRTTLSSYFTANSITDQSSDNDFKLFPVHKAGFKDTLTSYNAWVNNSGFSVSTVDNASEDIVRVWEACRRSRDTTSGGSTTCTPSYSTWAARAAARAADDIYQVRTNDFQGPRVYLETLMGITVNLQNISTAYLTEFRWNDHTNGTQRQGRFGWTSSSGSYGFLNQDGNYIAESPPIGGLMEKL